MGKQIKEPAQGSKIWAILAAVIIAAVVVGGGVCWWQRSIAESDRKAMQQQISDLQNQIVQLRASEAISQKPKSGWEEYFPTPTETTLMGESVSELRNLLGEPPVLVRSIAADPDCSREIWIYMPYDEDPTGLYIYFKGGKVAKSLLDEFNGLVGSSIWEDSDFWFK
ncbi:MAG: hypothetical protein QMD08_02785 [Actinomycetota bacterium]|nr:hypothetical protein [Actinomycetota bacterium]